MPDELELLSLLDRYGGAQNVLGRPLGYGEIRRMNYCQNVIAWYRERAASSDDEGRADWARWAGEYPDRAAVLNEAARLASLQEQLSGE